MKKIVVVVNIEYDEMVKESFEGENLSVHDSQQVGTIQAPVLTVLDGDVQLASFRKWVYWRMLEQA